MRKEWDKEICKENCWEFSQTGNRYQATDSKSLVNIKSVISIILECLLKMTCMTYMFC